MQYGWERTYGMWMAYSWIVPSLWGSKKKVWWGGLPRSIFGHTQWWPRKSKTSKNGDSYKGFVWLTRHFGGSPNSETNSSWRCDSWDSFPSLSLLPGQCPTGWPQPESNSKQEEADPEWLPTETCHSQKARRPGSALSQKLTGEVVHHLLYWYGHGSKPMVPSI